MHAQTGQADELSRHESVDAGANGERGDRRDAAPVAGACGREPPEPASCADVCAARSGTNAGCRVEARLSDPHAAEPVGGDNSSDTGTEATSLAEALLGVMGLSNDVSNVFKVRLVWCHSRTDVRPSALWVWIALQER